ncbi:hypothetical protein D3C72_2339470 [compost metagenome]
MNNTSPLLATHVRQYQMIQQHGTDQIPLYHGMNLSYTVIRKQTAFPDERSGIVHHNIDSA